MPEPHHFLPYQYPVAALLVDDDAPLAESLAAGLGRDRRVFTAHSSQHALERYRASRPARRSFICRSPDQTRLDQHRTVVDTTAVTSLMDDRSLQQEIGLLIVDYHMPGGDGLELCESLRDEPVRRVLLTGAADDRTAIMAFNSGLIHQFVRKSHDTLEQLGAALRREQRFYLREASSALSESLRDRLGTFEHEPAVCAALQTLIAQMGIVSYCLSADPNGLLALDRSGRRLRVLVQSEQERHSALEILGALGDEGELAAAMVYVDASGRSTPGLAPRLVQPLTRVAGASGVYRLAVEAC